jgi:preprotein translocase subunit SecG
MLKIFRNREGTAEVIGTIMFIVILLFFFTNVYLWHDAASKDANQLDVQKVNAGMSISFDSSNNQVIMNATSSQVTLSRLWIDTNDAHVYVDLGNISVAPGDEYAITINFVGGHYTVDSSGAFFATCEPLQGNTINVDYTLPEYTPQSVPVFTVVNTMGVDVST